VPAERAASSAPTSANGSAKTECSILIISRTVRMRLVTRTPRRKWKRENGKWASKNRLAPSWRCCGACGFLFWVRVFQLLRSNFHFLFSLLQFHVSTFRLFPPPSQRYCAS
jgi:hypothetical protein